MSEQRQEPETSTKRLRLRWRETFASEPPLGLGHDLLARAVAHRLQELAHATVSKAVLAKLARLAERSASANRRSAMLKAGTQLIREWQGTIHLVTALEEAYEYEGKRFSSLSEIAGVITGTKWSGPKFFGLKTAASGSGSSKADA